VAAGLTSLATSDLYVANAGAGRRATGASTALYTNAAKIEECTKEATWHLRRGRHLAEEISFKLLA